MATSTSPLMRSPPTLWQRFLFAIRIQLIKALVTSFISLTGLPGLRNTLTLPSFTKVYACRPGLTNRVFIPKSYTKGDAPLPLYLDVHGGGFVTGNPSIDDRFCFDFANDNKILVVSLDYPKAPAHPFPAPSEALVDAVKAVLADQSLPFDRKKVAIGGFSAGANLAIAVSQDQSMQGKLRGLISFYGPLDFSITNAEKLARRPADSGPDPLEMNAPAFEWAYVKADQDLTDPLLSVALASKEKLPPKLYIIGCELDMLCRESEMMAGQLAREGTGEMIPSDVIWERNGVKWEKILGEEHGFDMTLLATGEKKIRGEKRRKEMFESAAEWLFREVYV